MPSSSQSTRGGGGASTASATAGSTTSGASRTSPAREAVAALEVPWSAPLPQVTISAGVAVYRGERDVTDAVLLSRADEALYASKERGRNRTTIWGAGLLFRSRVALGGEKQDLA